MTGPEQGPTRISAPADPGTSPHRRNAPRRTDYAGAVYGSLLAASVIAASSTQEPHPRLTLVLLLIVTGVVFWMAHVYAHVAGERESGHAVTWRDVRSVAGREWSIVEAAVLPALAVLVSPWLGMADTAWLALGVAVAQQVAWATLGAHRAGASRGQVVAEGCVNLALGLLIVAAKVAVGH